MTSHCTGRPPSPGTESTGVSSEMLARCQRRVYLPMDGFSDSFNVGVSAALAIDRLKTMLGGGGEYLTDDWVRSPATSHALTATPIPWPPLTTTCTFLNVWCSFPNLVLLS
jgi:hypothetical protein